MQHCQDLKRLAAGTLEGSSKLCLLICQIMPGHVGHPGPAKAGTMASVIRTAPTGLPLLALETNVDALNWGVPEALLQEA